MIQPFYILDQLTTIARLSTPYMQAQSSQSDLLFRTPFSVLTSIPKRFSRHELQPTPVLSNLAYAADSTDGTLVFRVVFASVEGTDFEC